MKKVLMLAELRSSHTLKWIKGLTKKGFYIHLVSIYPGELSEYKDINNFSFDILINQNVLKETKFNINKLKYITYIFRIKSILKKIKPDLLHAHYATSYGFLGGLLKFKPFIISVWGSDVFDFPLKSFFHRQFLKYSLSKADIVLSTSKIMAKKTNVFIKNKKPIVTPFGIDIDIFKPNKKTNKNTITIGTVKTLEEKYGIEYLIHAFKRVLETYNGDYDLKLLIVGAGSKEEELILLSKKLDINSKTEFTGKIEYEEIYKYHQKIDMPVFTSVLDSESFGVAVLEACATQKPVIVTDVAGFKEIVINNETGFICERRNVSCIVDKILFLLNNPEQYRTMSENARKHVVKEYDFEKNLNQMCDIYNKTIDKFS